MQDKLSADTLVSRAKDNDERTEAHADVGIRALIAGRIDEARHHLQWVKERGSRNFVEYEMALAELSRLK